MVKDARVSFFMKFLELNIANTVRHSACASILAKNSVKMNCCLIVLIVLIVSVVDISGPNEGTLWRAWALLAHVFLKYGGTRTCRPQPRKE